jgi:aminopeptidase N
MMMIRKYIFLIYMTFSITPLFAENLQIHHELSIKIDPANNFISVSDIVTIPKSMLKPEIYFLLHGDFTLSPVPKSYEITLKTVKPEAVHFGLRENDFKLSNDVPLKLYTIELSSNYQENIELTISYEGKINHPVKQLSEEYARGFSETPGLITAEGIYLAGATYWIPWFNNGLITFNMSVSSPADWKTVTQGERTQSSLLQNKQQEQWQSKQPMEEIYLIAAPFIEYQEDFGNIKAMVFLRSADQNLANKYLETTAQYLKMYEELVGTFPYSKFALVENFWETGYGMPSFTLLGQTVIRFPFILHSSYPHELLHNWWGNSVYVDYQSGNWCEGLTVYLADHLIAEQRNQGADYRRTSLQAYTDYVNEVNDFPLTNFQSRYNVVTSTIGYNKSMMIFNMLRLNIGDEAFIKSMQKFYTENKFKRAGFIDIFNAVESTTGKDFDRFFRQWILQKGAPQLKLSNVQVKEDQNGYLLFFDIMQIQNGNIFTLDIPVTIQMEGGDKLIAKNLYLDQKSKTFELVLKEKPLLLDIDPQFDVFRKLHRNEIPPAFSQVFGAKKVVVILPTKENHEFLNGYKELAESWANTRSSEIEIVMDNEIKEVPTDAAVWLFGLNNLFLDRFQKKITDYNSVLETNSIRLLQTNVELDKNSVATVVRNPKNPEQVLVWLCADNVAALSGLGRKLPHYGKYSYLAFTGSEPTNIVKGQWPALNSPMRAYLQNEQIYSSNVKMPVRQPLAKLAPIFSAKRMIEHINTLASESFQGRGLGSKGLDEAGEYIANKFKEFGLLPGGVNNTYYQEWEDTGQDEKVVQLKNVIGILPGKKEEWKKQSVIVCAHYDHLGLGWPDVHRGDEGHIHFGADDNASGVAVLLELTKTISESMNMDRNIIFVAFTGEESGLRGSRYYVQNMKNYPLNQVMGVLNLDTVGRLGKNKLLVINSSSANEWQHIVRGIGYVSGIDYELVSQDLDASDQVSFVDAGIPAIQLFSGAHRDYHKPTDTADKIDSQGLVKVATFTKEAVEYLASREESMTFMGKQSENRALVGKTNPRKVGTGIMPDFSFSEQGVRIGDIAPNSPAEAAGLMVDDIIVQVGTKKIENLRQYSNILKEHNPGDEIEFSCIRQGEKVKVIVKLAVR